MLAKSNQKYSQEIKAQPRRDITLVEQDARVSANFTQKWQEKNCNTFVGKKRFVTL